MQLTGEYRFPKPPQDVWDALMNPDVLAGCIPGCRSIEPDGPDRYRATATVRVGPVSGNYTATVALSDLDPPNSYTMTIEGSGNLGFANGTSSVAADADLGRGHPGASGRGQPGGWRGGSGRATYDGIGGERDVGPVFRLPRRVGIGTRIPNLPDVGRDISVGEL